MQTPAPSSSPESEICVADPDLDALNLKELQDLASQVGVGTFGLDRDALLEKLIFEGSH